MAYTNIENGEIVDCKEGTKEYFHEEGHIVYNKSEKGIKNGYKASFFFYIAVTFGILALDAKLTSICAFLFIVIFWYYFIYEEVWCWGYANKKLKGGKTNVDKKR